MIIVKDKLLGAYTVIAGILIIVCFLLAGGFWSGNEFNLCSAILSSTGHALIIGSWVLIAVNNKDYKYSFVIVLFIIQMIGVIMTLFGIVYSVFFVLGGISSGFIFTGMLLNDTVYKKFPLVVRFLPVLYAIVLIYQLFLPYAINSLIAFYIFLTGIAILIALLYAFRKIYPVNKILFFYILAKSYACLNYFLDYFYHIKII